MSFYSHLWQQSLIKHIAIHMYWKMSLFVWVVCLYVAWFVCLFIWVFLPLDSSCDEQEDILSTSCDEDSDSDYEDPSNKSEGSFVDIDADQIYLGTVGSLIALLEGLKVL
jgi:hypothetical protein